MDSAGSRDRSSRSKYVASVKDVLIRSGETINKVRAVSFAVSLSEKVYSLPAELFGK